MASQTHHMSYRRGLCGGYTGWLARTPSMRAPCVCPQLVVGRRRPVAIVARLADRADHRSAADKVPERSASCSQHDSCRTCCVLCCVDHDSVSACGWCLGGGRGARRFRPRSGRPADLSFAMPLTARRARGSRTPVQQHPLRHIVTYCIWRSHGRTMYMAWWTSPPVPPRQRPARPHTECRDSFEMGVNWRARAKWRLGMARTCGHLSAVAVAPGTIDVC